MQRSLEREKCPECGGTKLIKDEESGEVICGECGLVIAEETLSARPEWRAFSSDERTARGRVGPPISSSLYDKGLSTTIQVGRDASGRALRPETRYRMMRLRKWNIRSRMRSTFERNLLQAMNELEVISDRLQIPPSVQETAAVTYRKALRKDLVRGRSIPAIVAASVLYACRVSNTPRSLKEVADASGRSWKEVARCYRLLLRELTLNMPIDDPIHFVSKIGSRAGLSQKTQTKAVEVLRQATAKKVTVGKAPIGVAAAALYIASQMVGEKITQKELASAANITEVTVRNRYKGLSREMGLSVSER